MLRFSLDVAITGVWSLEKPLSSWLGRNTWRELSSATSKVLEKGEVGRVLNEAEQIKRGSDSEEEEEEEGGGGGRGGGGFFELGRGGGVFVTLV